MTFSQDGSLLATAGKDKKIAIVDASGKTSASLKKAHDDSINKIRFIEECLVSGDDSGCVKIWDLRSGKTAIMEFKQQSEAVTGLQHKDRILVTTSLDGTLAVYDTGLGMGTKGLVALSDNMEEQLLGVKLVKDGTFLACNSSEGTILLFKWDWFGDCKDRVLGHPNSIDAMLKYDEKTLITGAQDGFLRAVGLFPNKVLKMLGQHEQQMFFPIQNLAMSSDKKMVASCSHDQSIKFHDITSLAKRNQQKQESESEVEVDEEDALESEEKQAPPKERVKQKGKVKLAERKSQVKRNKASNFFSDL